MPRRPVRRLKVSKSAMRRLAMRGRRIRRAVLSNQPTFVETFHKSSDDCAVPLGGSLGKLFKVRIQDVPQVAQYANLYTQYRINWVKITLIPQYNTSASDFNTARANQVAHADSAGMARIVYSIQDSPGQTDPTTELEVLEDNGCKVRAMGKMWSCSFKPVADVVVSNGAGGVIPVKQKFKQWFNFDTSTPANNPYHEGVKAFITLPGTNEDTNSITWSAYYKVSFTLRDPQ